MTTRWLRKDNIWIEVGSIQLTANRSWLQGLSVLSDSSVRRRQPAPEEVRKTPGCKFSRSVGEVGGGALFFFFCNVIRLSNTQIHSSQGESLNTKNTPFFYCGGTILFLVHNLSIDLSGRLRVNQTSHMSLMVFSHRDTCCFTAPRWAQQRPLLDESLGCRLPEITLAWQRQVQ